MLQLLLVDLGMHIQYEQVLNLEDLSPFKVFDFVMNKPTHLILLSSC